ncbi:MAG TPA: nodulation protein NfeD [Chthonomonadales bacterium]|nr:nodulation protein NfeD [Chthonomonadales bacterium]
MKRLRRALVALTALAAVCSLAAVASPPSKAPLIVVARLDTPVLPPTEGHLKRALQRAERDGATLLLVEMDTPGGSLEVTRGLVKLFLASRVPVVVYVTPKGGQASSAGAIIGLSAHVLAMAPGTNIGAAHPVTGAGTDIPGDMKDKLVNDTAAFARTIAEQRGRSVRWADEIIRHSVSASEKEAVRLDVADLIASSREDLLAKLDGRVVTTDGGQQVLRTAGARTEEQARTWLERLLLLISNPNVALLLGAVAMYGIITEVTNPGTIYPGVVGVIALLLALYSLSVLSVSATGVALLLLALLLFVVDVYAATHGILTGGGVIAFVFGAMMLFNDPVASSQLSLTVVITIGLLTGLFFSTIAAAAWRSQRRKAGSGPEMLVGSEGDARTQVNPTGMVFVAGSLWRATNVGEEPIAQGDPIVVVSREGLKLRVRRAAPSAAGPIYAAPGDGAAH